MKFTGKKITAINESVGETLKKLRIEKNLSEEEVAETLDIKKKYIKFLEEDDFKNLPEGLYKKTFLKKYCQFLGLDWKKIKKELKNKGVLKEKKKFSFLPKSIKKRELIIFPKILRNIIVGVIISAFFVYIGFYIKVSFSPPNIKIIEPENNLIINSHSIKIIGETEVKTQININGIAVLNNEKGLFEQVINLKTGINIITVTAQKKYGPKKIITREILVE